MNGLTREQILAMEPGRELDSWIATEVIGLENLNFAYEDDPNGIWYGKAPHLKLYSVLPYSTSISAAFEVVEKYKWLQIKKYETVGDEIRFTVYIESNEYQELPHDIFVTAKTLPEAICKAALLAVMDG